MPEDARPPSSPTSREDDTKKQTLIPLTNGGILPAAAGAANADRNTFHKDHNLRNRQFTAEGLVAHFDRIGFNDRFHSAVVHDGRWEICFDADFNGSCSTLVPGVYPDLGAFAGRIGSACPTDGGQGINRPGDCNRVAHATLYEGSNLSGRLYGLNDMMQGLGTTGSNDRASSLRVETGYWTFCSDAYFHGECPAFGAGDHASTPGLNSTISSGRLIANDYPNRDRPNWQSDSYQQSRNDQTRRLAFAKVTPIGYLTT